MKAKDKGDNIMEERFDTQLVKLMTAQLDTDTIKFLMLTMEKELERRHRREEIKEDISKLVKEYKLLGGIR